MKMKEFGLGWATRSNFYCVDPPLTSDTTSTLQKVRLQQVPLNEQIHMNSIYKGVEVQF